jgi:aminomethyltransferase
MFDISHMGEVTVSGPGALAWLESLLTNRVGKLAITRGQYTLMLDERGGVIDDLIIYRTGEMSYFLVINGACRDIDLEWMRSRLPADGSVLLEDQGNDYAAIALQGPDSEKLLRVLYPECDIPKRNGITSLVASEGTIPSLVARTGYTGEDGFELFVPVGAGIALWESLLAAGVKPCGLGSRDTLRLEMGYPLNGSDLSRERTPLEAGLDKFTGIDDPEKEDFSGRKALEIQRSEGLPSRLTPLKLSVQGPPLRSHYSVLSGDSVVGETCSGALSPTLGEGIAMAYLPPALHAPGTSLEIEVRGRRYPATVSTLPFYKKPNL